MYLKTLAKLLPDYFSSSPGNTLFRLQKKNTCKLKNQKLLNELLQHALAVKHIRYIVTLHVEILLVGVAGYTIYLYKNRRNQALFPKSITFQFSGKDALFTTPALWYGESRYENTAGRVFPYAAAPKSTKKGERLLLRRAAACALRRTLLL